MPDLAKSLQGKDLGHLQIIADHWRIELEGRDNRSAARSLIDSLLNRESLEEVIDLLPPGARSALMDLLQQNGRLPLALCKRRYGDLREMGPARRDRERPFDDRNASPLEALWYRGLIGIDFFDTPNGPEEFVFIPTDLMALMPMPPSLMRPFGRAATPTERATVFPAVDTILDDACTLLAGLRLGMSLEIVDEHLISARDSAYPITTTFLKTLLLSAGILDDNMTPNPEPTRIFLEMDRGTALSLLVSRWLESKDVNELLQLPGVIAEGKWQNDPLQTRKVVMDILGSLPGWPSSFSTTQPESASPLWSLSAFIAAVKQLRPDFQRPAGDYDTYFLKDRITGAFLRGFQYWDEVDGTLLRYFICGPLYWLGLVDLASPAESRTVTAFCPSRWAKALLRGETPLETSTEAEFLLIASDGRMWMPQLAPRSGRYQLARFCEWDGYQNGTYIYHLTPSSLERARSQGLGISQLLILLRRYSKSVPPGLVKTLNRWEAHGTEARLEHVDILRVKDTNILQTLRASKAGRFLGDPLGPTAIIVKPGAGKKILQILFEMGFMGEIVDTSE